jgi:hypothetical protein
MAESYTVPGKSCSVDSIKAQYPGLDDLRGWKAYCDCMFLEPVSYESVTVDGVQVAASREGGRVIIDPNTRRATGAPTEAAYNQHIVASANAAKAAGRGGAVVVKVEIGEAKTENWTKCMSNFCTIPLFGCPHPIVSGLQMPFNISPFAGSPPWTELGASARGIPKRDAGFFYTVGQIITIDLKSYEPLSLWRNLVSNPALYELNRAKLNVIPGVGSAIATALGAPFPINWAYLGPLALAQCGIEGKSRDRA